MNEIEKRESGHGPLPFYDMAMDRKQEIRGHVWDVRRNSLLWTFTAGVGVFVVFVLVLQTKSWRIGEISGLAWFLFAFSFVWGTANQGIVLDNSQWRAWRWRRILCFSWGRYILPDELKKAEVGCRRYQPFPQRYCYHWRAVLLLESELITLCTGSGERVEVYGDTMVRFLAGESVPEDIDPGDATHNIVIWMLAIFTAIYMAISWL